VSENKGRERVTCTIDPTHTCWKDQLQQHVLICPVAKDVEIMKKQEFYCLDCNGGGGGIVLNTEEDDFSNTPIDGEALCAKICRVYEQAVAPYTEFSVEDFTKFAAKSSSSSEVQSVLPHDDELVYKEIERKVMVALAVNQTSFDR